METNKRKKHKALSMVTATVLAVAVFCIPVGSFADTEADITGSGQMIENGREMYPNVNVWQFRTEYIFIHMQTVW